MLLNTDQDRPLARLQDGLGVGLLENQARGDDAQPRHKVTDPATM
jgi:hypothetical protein